MNHSQQVNKDGSIRKKRKPYVSKEHLEFRESDKKVVSSFYLSKITIEQIYELQQNETFNVSGASYNSVAIRCLEYGLNHFMDKYKKPIDNLSYKEFFDNLKREKAEKAAKREQKELEKMEREAKEKGII